jgi:hypothetical protein
MNEEVPSLTNAREGVRERSSVVLCGCSIVADSIALTIVRRAVANPKQKAVQPFLAAIASSPKQASQRLSGSPEVHSPPGVWLA